MNGKGNCAKAGIGDVPTLPICVEKPGVWSGKRNSAKGWDGAVFFPFFLEIRDGSGEERATEPGQIYSISSKTGAQNRVFRGAKA